MKPIRRLFGVTRKNPSTSDEEALVETGSREYNRNVALTYGDSKADDYPNDHTDVARWGNALDPICESGNKTTLNLLQGRVCGPRTPGKSRIIRNILCTVNTILEQASPICTSLPLKLCAMPTGGVGIPSCRNKTSEKYSTRSIPARSRSKLQPGQCLECPHWLLPPSPGSLVL
jgi:hypothetical protein